MAYTPVELQRNGKTEIAETAAEETRLRWQGWLPTGAPVLDNSNDPVRVSDLTNASSPARVALKAAFGSWLDDEGGVGGGLEPSGDVTGATDQAAITAALATGSAHLGPGRFYITGIVMPSGSTLSLDDTELYLVSGANQPIIRNATIGKRTAVGADHDIAIIARGHSSLNGNPEGQTGFTGTTYWLNQGVVMCGVTRLHLEGLRIRAKKGAIHLIGCDDVTGGRFYFDQAGANNQDGLDIGPDSHRIRLSGFAGVTNDDFFSFYAKYTAAMIPPASGYAATDGTGGGSITDVLITNVIGLGNAENLIRLQAADGHLMDRVAFADIVSAGTNTLMRLGPTSYATTPPTATQFRNISLRDFIYAGSGLTIESPCSGITVGQGQFTGPGKTALIVEALGTDVRALTLEDIVFNEATTGVSTVMRTAAAAVVDGVTIRQVHVGRGRLLVNSGTVTNLRARNVSFRVAAEALLQSTVAETGHIADVSVDTFTSGLSTVLAGAPSKLRFSGAFPLLGGGDVTPTPVAGSRLIAAAGKDLTGGSFAQGAEYVADGTGWNRGTVFAATPPAADTTAPTVPGTPVAAAGQTSATATTTGSTDAVGVTAYKWRRNGSTVISGQTGSSLTDTGLTAGTPVYYTVSALDAAGNESAQSANSNTVTPTAPPADTTAPTAPGTPTATAGTNSASVAFSPATDNIAVTGYRVYSSADSYTAQVASGTSSPITVGSLTAGTPLTFKVAAVDAAGNVSPQTAASNSVTPTAPPAGGAAFVTDTFTGTDGTAITAHTGETGATWTKHPSFTGTPELVSNRLRYASSTSGLVLASGTPADINYTVEADVYFPAVPTTQNIGVSARVDPTVNTQYTVRYIASGDLFRFDRITGGTTLTLGSVVAGAAAGATRHIKLRPAATGGGMTASVDGVDITITTADTVPLTSPGRVGVFGNNTSSATTGVLLDNFTASPLA